eukprot:182265_1
MNITYKISDLSSANIELMEDHTEDVVPDIVEIIESNYFVENVIEYQDFVVNVANINGFEDLANINLKEGEPVMLNSVILSREEIAGVLLKKSSDDVAIFEDG